MKKPPEGIYSPCSILADAFAILMASPKGLLVQSSVTSTGVSAMAFSSDSGAYHADSVDLSGSVFHNSNLSNSKFVDVNLRGVEFRNVAFTNGSIRDACLGDFTIEGAGYDGMRIEGILVTDLLRVYREQCETQGLAQVSPGRGATNT